MKFLTHTLLTATLLFTACSQQKSLKVAQDDADVLAVTLIPFENDTLGLSRRLHTQLQKDDRLYLLSNEDLHVDKRQRLPAGMTLHDVALHNSKALGVSTIIVGRLHKTKYQKKRYFKTKTVCFEGKCWQRDVQCLKSSLTLQADIKILDYKSNKTLLATSMKNSKKWQECADETQKNISAKEEQEKLVTKMVLRLEEKVLKTLF